MLDTFERRLSRIILMTCYAFLLAMVVIVSYEIIARWIGRPVTWASEVPAHMFVWLGWLAVVATFQFNRHIKVEVVSERLPAKAKRVLSMVSDILVLVVSVTLFWQSSLYFFEAFSKHQMYAGALRTPIWWTSIIVPPSALLLVVLALVQFYRHLFSKQLDMNQRSQNNNVLEARQQGSE